MPGSITSCRAVTISPATTAVVLSGLTIRNGSAYYSEISGSSGDGGGIYSSGPLSINNSTVSGNSVVGIASGGGTVKIQNSIVANNTRGN